jgi:type II secretory pathway component GspD/PulD (secretin)
MIFKRKRIIIIVLTAFLGSSVWLISPGSSYGSNPDLQLKNLEFINVALRQVFRSLAALGSFNIVLDQTVKGNVSIAFKAGITAKEAVAVIANNYGYGYQWIPNSEAVFIGNLKAFPSGFGDKKPADIQLKFADASAAAGSLEIVIPKELIKPDSNGHKVTVFGNPLELQNITEIITRVDHRAFSVDVEIKVAEVADEFWNDTGINIAVIRSHLGIYSLAQPQAKVLGTGANSNIIHYLARQNISLFDNQEVKLFLGDKFPEIIKKRTDPAEVNSAVKDYLNIGTTVKITSWAGEGNRITLQVQELTEIITNQPQAESNFIPVAGSREVTSSITVTDGQTFILTGVIGRDEYNRIKSVPGKYPVLQELFATDNAFQASQKAHTLVIMLITPRFIENSTNPNPPNDEQKTEVIIDLPGTTPKPNQQTTQAGSTTIVEYPVKKNDTIRGVAAKFGIELQAIITANKLIDNNLKLKILLIPVPNERIYTVKPKETLWRIAKRYGTTIELLKEINNITDIRKVKAGQKIVLPVSTKNIKNPQF